jgi:hypothetical protein
MGRSECDPPLRTHSSSSLHFLVDFYLRIIRKNRKKRRTYNSPMSFELKSNAKCLVALADEVHHSFLVSTANLRGPNEVRSP